MTNAIRCRTAVAALRGAALLALFGAVGCASYSTHLSPTPTAKGHVDLDIVVDVASVKTFDKRIVVPQPEIGFRYGISDKVDFGGRMNPMKLGGELNARILLVRSEGFHLGIIPGAGMGFGAFSDTDISGLVTYFTLPLLAGINFGDDFQLILGPKIIAQFAMFTSKEVANNNGTATSGTDGGSIVLLPGGLVAMSIKLSDKFALVPEVTVLYPKDVDATKWNQPFFQGGLAFAIQVD